MLRMVEGVCPEVRTLEVSESKTTWWRGGGKALEVEGTALVGSRRGGCGFGQDRVSAHPTRRSWGLFLYMPAKVIGSVF